MVCKLSNGISEPCSAFLLYTATQACIVHEIHTLVFTCNTAFPNCSLLCTSTKEKRQETAVTKAREQNLFLVDCDSVSVMFALTSYFNR